MQLQTYSFSTGVVALAGTDGLQVAQTVVLSTDADFAVHSLCGGAIQSSALVGTWAGRVQIQTESVGSTWFNTDILFDSIAGNGRYPFILDPPKLVPSKTSIIVSFTQEGTTATDVELVFHGNKVFGA